MGLRFFLKTLFVLPLIFIFLWLPRNSYASTITSIDLQDWHSFSDICSTNPPAESQLLGFVNVTVYGNNTQDFDYIYYYINYQNGDSAPPNTVLMDYGAGGKWWKYPVASSFYLNNGYNSLSVKGLVSSTRTFQVNLYDSINRITRSYQRVSHLLDRTPPNYSGSFSSPNWSGSPKLRTITNGSYSPTGVLGNQVTLQPYPQRYDNGGFGFDRVDLWIAYKAGDNPSFVMCPPNPPYDPGYSSGVCNPFSCASFGLGSDKAWYIGSVYGTNGGIVNWDTTGFAPGTRYIIANAFDNPGNRMAQNFMTYTGNGINSYFARVDYDLSGELTPSPTPSPSPSPTPTTTPTPTPTPTATPTATPTPTLSPTPTPITTKYNVSGIVFVDSNKNGKKDTGEANYQGSLSIISSAGTVTYPSIANYTITNLAAGKYTIAFKIPYGYTATYPRASFGSASYSATVPCIASSLNPPSKNVLFPCVGNNIIGADFGIARSYRGF